MLFRKSIRYPNSVLRNRYFFIADIWLVLLAAAASFYLRLDAEKIFPYLPTMGVVAVVSVLVKPIVFYFFGLYRRYWRYASVDDMLVIAVAVSTASLITALIEILSIPLWVHFLSVPRSIPIIDWLLTLLLVGGVRFFLDSQRKAQDAERRLEAHIYTHKSAQDTYLTPVKMQDFRLFTGAPVYIDFKSIPYKDSDVLEWYRRVRLADRFYETKDCEVLQALAGEGVTHAVLARADLPLACPLIEETYRDPDFSVYRLLPPR